MIRQLVIAALALGVSGAMAADYSKQKTQAQPGTSASSDTSSQAAATSPSMPAPSASSSSAAAGQNQPAAGQNQPASDLKQGSMASTDMSGMQHGGKAAKKKHHADASMAGADSKVKQAQLALKDKGHDPGPIDGVLGPKTRNALESFQQAQGIDKSGQLDQKTLAALGIGGEKLSQAPTPATNGGTNAAQGAGSAQGLQSSASGTNQPSSPMAQAPSTNASSMSSNQAPSTNAPSTNAPSTNAASSTNQAPSSGTNLPSGTNQSRSQ